MSSKVCARCGNEPGVFYENIDEGFVVPVCPSCATREEGFVEYNCGCQGIRMTVGDRGIDILIKDCCGEGEEVFSITSKLARNSSKRMSDWAASILITRIDKLIYDGHQMHIIRNILGNKS